MNAAAAKPKTLAEQKAHTAEAHPDVQLDLGDTGAKIDETTTEESTPTPSVLDAVPEDGTCGATRYQGGGLRTCELPIHHPGNHIDGDRGWRRSHGDGPHRAELVEDATEEDPAA